MDLSPRALNRALLARQLLLERVRLDPVQAVARLSGLQAQLARPPYLALWSRLAGFERQALTRAVLGKQLVRGTLYRGTIHLVTTADYLWQRPMIDAVIERATPRPVQERLARLDVVACLLRARKFFAEPHPIDAFRKLQPGDEPDRRALAFVARVRLPLVQVPDEDSAWGYHGQAGFMLAETFLGKKLGKPNPRELVRRYLAAFGPATVADCEAWSGLRGLAPAFAGQELLHEGKLYDLPDAPRPHADTPAPVRFLPDFDNALLGHADRSRIVDDAHRKLLASNNLRVLSVFLVDGRVAGSWTSAVVRKVATLTATPFIKLSAAQKKALVAEGEALLRFAEPEARDHHVVF